MHFQRIIRLISTSSIAKQSSNKSPLASLRKKTGYTFSNCKKALELNENDLEKAESWLKIQAQELGWSKAAQVQNRVTSQGLVSLIIDKSYGAIVEINCETDFVSRNKQFQELSQTVVSAVLQHSKTIINETSFNKIILDSDKLKALSGPDGISIADHTALMIGQIRENINIKRALAISVPSDILLIGSTHPFSSNNNVLYGKYGVLLAFKSKALEMQQEIGENLCQHIIGMNPLKIGEPEIDQANPNPEDETTLIHQEYLLDHSLTVREYLEDTGTHILDFIRFEMGEIAEGQQNLDAVETGG
ncbi:PREDICTED: elongation factor Ts, mitochondrial [Ceratosolen solmsi marchali]|uniref:Elongation factor Ts, mitochondrial n=1 Tax=Ceratosolen solmsi marchali TaxID=326594 RepID=A0AAJ6YW75_9HYME|nr:PREDICTED: elongation factor Ts, mitochondrial [Ceratosolen solmsi marchali]